MNNAGVPGRGTFLRLPPERIEEITNINYLGNVWCLRAFLPALEAAAPADVVNVVSVAGTVAAGSGGPYTASKHAQLAFSRSARSQLGPRGIRVHTILPGFVETAGFPQRSRFSNRLVRGLVVDPELVAERIMKALEHDPKEVFVPRLVPRRSARASACTGSRGAHRRAWDPPVRRLRLRHRGSAHRRGGSQGRRVSSRPEALPAHV